VSGEPTEGADTSASHQALANELRLHAQSLADQTAALHLQEHPHLVDNYGPQAITRCREDGKFHIDHLAAALATGRPQLFDDYVAWLRDLLHTYGMDHDDIAYHLGILVEVIGETLGPNARATADVLVAHGLANDTLPTTTQASHLDLGTSLGVLASDYLNALLSRDRRRALTLIQEAADDGVDIADLYLQVFAPVLLEVGRLWQVGQATVGQEHLVTAATQLAMAQLYPRTFATPRNNRTVVVAAVGGELHEVGARMVADLFELDGWDSHFLGANTPTSAIVDTVEQVGADLLAVSVTLPTHILMAAELISKCRELSPNTTILAGGRPFAMIPDLWQQIGADGTAGDARDAVLLAAELAQAS